MCNFLFLLTERMAGNNFSLLFKYIIIGDTGVGKSCLLLQFTGFFPSPFFGSFFLFLFYWLRCYCLRSVDADDAFLFSLFLDFFFFVGTGKILGSLMSSCC